MGIENVIVQVGIVWTPEDSSSNTKDFGFSESEEQRGHLIKVPFRVAILKFYEY